MSGFMYTPFGLGAAKMHKAKRGTVVKRADCSSGALYTTPLSGQSISPSSPFTIGWSPSCLPTDPAPSALDIYLYAPAAATPLVHVWAGVPASGGSYTDTLYPEWWNATAGETESLQLLIVESGSPAWMTTAPSGPIFTVQTPLNYTSATNTPSSSSSGSSSTPTLPTSSNPNSIVESVASLFYNHGITKGGIAAAVLLPILFLLTAAFFYIRYQRKKEAAARKRWSAAIDKRMSVVSTDWKSMSAAGARASIAVGSHRGSLATSQYFLPGRPSSTFASEGSAGGQAGIGAHRPDMSEVGVRPSFNTSRSGGSIPTLPTSRTLNAPQTPTSRLSRVSFAPTVHPRLSLAAKDVLGEFAEEEEEGRDGGMSPTQVEGPRVLGEEDVGRGSMDEAYRREMLQMPAITVMRTGRLSTHILQPPVPPLPAYATSLNTNTNTSPTKSKSLASPSPRSPTPPKSPLIGLFPQPLAAPAPHMTPDEQLRAYAARRAASPMPPVPAHQPQGMRVLYDPTAHAALSPTMPTSGRTLSADVNVNNPFRTSTAGESVASRYSEHVDRTDSYYDGAYAEGDYYAGEGEGEGDETHQGTAA